MKKLWNNLNHIASLGKNKATNNVQKLLLENASIEDPIQISNYFNKYFCNVGRNLQNKLKPGNGSDFKSYLSPSTQDIMYCEPATQNEILHIITKLNNNKSPGPDMITSKLLKSIVNEIIDPLLHLFNFSLSSGIVPSALKLAKVTPVYKKGDKQLVNNYRPIKSWRRLCIVAYILIFVIKIC